jgi:citrate synthase
VRGHDIEDLAGEISFEAAVAILWSDIVPAPSSEAELARAIAAGRREAFERFRPLAATAAALTPVEGLLLFLSAIGDGDTLAHPAEMVGALGVAAAMAVRLDEGQEPLPPDAGAGQAADLLRLIHGRPADAAERRAFEAYLVTVMDHGFNASTFTARVVASTAAGLPSSLVAALCALKGPLHGGAPGPVLDMLDAIGSADNAEAWLYDALQRGERLMGFGHRIYRVRDPRADVLKRVLQSLRGRADRLALAEAVERAALGLLRRRKLNRSLDVNVEFYTALLLEALDIPRAGFTPVFAAGRAAGWIAHVYEQEATGRLIRPKSRYVGPRPPELPARAAS